MMISTRGRYALRFLIDIAEHQDQGYVPLRDVARRQEISDKYLESIVKTLVRGQVLDALRGKGGGYRLHGSPVLHKCQEDIRNFLQIRTHNSFLRIFHIYPSGCNRQTPEFPRLSVSAKTLRLRRN